jgi:hypothetical protein
MSILELVNSPECCRRKQVPETASHVFWLWRFGHMKIQAAESTFCLTRWLWRHLCQQDVALCSKCGAAESMNIRAAQRSVWSKCVGHCGACPSSVLFYIGGCLLILVIIETIRREVIRKELEIPGIQDMRSKHKQTWINHLERMDNTRLLKHALNYRPRGRRDRGRPRKWQCINARTDQMT